MKAAVYGRNIQIKEVAKPVPKDNEVLVRVHACTICAADFRMRKVIPYIGWAIRLFKRGKPIILGMELSGTVESTGSAATKFRPGDQVFGGTGFELGTHAEYAVAKERGLELQPPNLTREESAAVFFGGMTSLSIIRKANIQPGQKVLVYGASGSCGVFGVQLAKYFGAHVTGVCSTTNLEMVKSLGADAVIDYTKEDFSQAGPIYDVIFETVGRAGLSRCMRALKPGAALGLISFPATFPTFIAEMFQQIWISMRGTAKMIGGAAKPEPGDMKVLKDLVEAGTLRTVIDRTYPFSQISDAQAYAGAGHKKGHVVILVEASQ